MFGCAVLILCSEDSRGHRTTPSSRPDVCVFSTAGSARPRPEVRRMFLAGSAPRPAWATRWARRRGGRCPLTHARTAELNARRAGSRL